MAVDEKDKKARIRLAKRDSMDDVFKALHAKPDLFPPQATGADGAKELIDAAEKLREYLHPESIED